MAKARGATAGRRTVWVLAVVAAALFAGGWTMAQAETGSLGALDDGFGDGGVVVNDYASLGWACATQSTGQVIVAGEAIVTPIEENAQGYVARYELDGSLDGDFGSDGWVTVNLGSYWTRWYPQDVVVDAQDKIIVVGYIERVEETTVTTGRGKKQTTDTISEVVDRQIAVLRLLSTGVADTGFGTSGSGLVTTGIAGCDDEWANSVVLLADGGLVVGGAGTFTNEVTSTSSGGGKKGKKGSTTTTVSSRGAILIRYDQYGYEVSNFGEDGVGVVIDNPNTDDGLGDGVADHGLGVQVDAGRIVYLTHGRSVRGCDLSTGELDDNFNEDALSTIATSGDVRTEVFLSRLAVNDSDGESILISGSVLDETDAGTDGLLIRMAPDGQSAFEYTLSGAEDIHFAAIGIHDEGGVAVGCQAGVASEDTYVVRLHVDLTLDLTFEIAPTAGANIEDIAFDGDDIVLAGTLLGSPQWLVVRYLGD